MLADVIKRRWHRDLVASPVTHAWVLSLYRAGERHPERVTDYFPARLAPTAWLAGALERHRDDERRHGQTLAKLVRRMGEPLVELTDEDDVFNHVIRRCTGATFEVDESATEDARRLALAHFLAHAYHLERRVARSLELHLEACRDAGVRVVAMAVEGIYRDELRHIGYTREAVYELLPRGDAEGVMALHRRAEARANLLFSQAQVRRFVARFPARVPALRRAMYRFCAALQEEAARHV